MTPDLLRQIRCDRPQEVTAALLGMPVGTAYMVEYFPRPTFLVIRRTPDTWTLAAPGQGVWSRIDISTESFWAQPKAFWYIDENSRSRPYKSMRAATGAFLRSIGAVT